MHLVCQTGDLAIRAVLQTASTVYSLIDQERVL